ncbi:MAG: hypothetical protein ABEJ31_14475 [Haloarculaceae archaeon]
MSDDGTYVHDPDAIDESDGPSAAEREPAVDAAGRPDPDPDAAFDWGGWVLVAVIVVSFLVVPGALYLAPPARQAAAGLGLGYQNTYLALPMVPALLLGAVAVWSAVRSRAR